MTTHRAERRAALVTGGAVRLGRAIALRLAEEGYDIALHYGTSADAAARTQAEIRALGVECASFPHDLSDADGIDAFLGRVRDAMPHLGVVVNSASRYASGTIAETSVSQFDALVAVNLRAPFFVTRAFGRQVRSGSIVNVLDNKIGFDQFEYAAYLLTKKALADLTRMAALELAPRIRVNAVAPGVVLPAESRTPQYVAWRVEGIPLRMQGDPRHVTDAVMALIGNEFVTGQTLTVDGGENIASTGRNAPSWDRGEGRS